MCATTITVRANIFHLIKLGEGSVHCANNTVSANYFIQGQHGK